MPPFDSSPAQRITRHLLTDMSTTMLNGAGEAVQGLVNVTETSFGLSRTVSSAATAI